MFFLTKVELIQSEGLQFILQDIVCYYEYQIPMNRATLRSCPPPLGSYLPQCARRLPMIMTALPEVLYDTVDAPMDKAGRLLFH